MTGTAFRSGKKEGVAPDITGVPDALHYRLGFSNPGNKLILMMFTAMLVAFSAPLRILLLMHTEERIFLMKSLDSGHLSICQATGLETCLHQAGVLSWPTTCHGRSLFYYGALYAYRHHYNPFYPEPETAAGTPTTLKAAVIDPFVEYFKRSGAIWMLAFILLYKVGDMMASAITTPFYMDIGFSKTEIGTVVKLFGVWAIIAVLLSRHNHCKAWYYRSLWIFGFLQAISTAGFAILARVGHNIFALSGVIAFENLSMGMGTAAFLAFMASITDKRFTATQYALLSSLMAVPRVIISAPTGYLAKVMGWESFFILCTLIAIPGMLLLLKFAPWNEDK